MKDAKWDVDHYRARGAVISARAESIARKPVAGVFRLVRFDPRVCRQIRVTNHNN